MTVNEPGIKNRGYAAGRPSLTRRILIIVTLSVFLPLVCGGCCRKPEKYSYEFLGTFDTFIQFTGYADSPEDFDEMAKRGQKRFEYLHMLFDIYNSYEGVNNIKTVNDMAGLEAVEVPRELLDVIALSIEWHKKTNSAVNIALGPVLSIWHDYRIEGLAEPGRAMLPDMEDLELAYSKSDIRNIEVDHDKGTVFLTDKGMKLDLGAVAKGYAIEMVARELIDEGYDSFVISGGGNVRAVGRPEGGKRDEWVVGLQSPDGISSSYDEDLLDLAYVSDMSVVSSGDYQRYYTVDGERYHHIIDPGTLMPARHYRSVTVISGDAGIGDILSTALFILPYGEGRLLVESDEDAEALWVMADGSIEATDGMRKALKNLFVKQ